MVIERFNGCIEATMEGSHCGFMSWVLLKSSVGSAPAVFEGRVISCESPLFKIRSVAILEIGQWLESARTDGERPSFIGKIRVLSPLDS
jgi:hypothetical protein